jgi:hypothetical protein
VPEPESEYGEDLKALIIKKMFNDALLYGAGLLFWQVRPWPIGQQAVFLRKS